MIYPESFESKIGFVQIRRNIAAMCVSATARELVEKMCFSTDFNVVERRLGEVGEMLAIVDSGRDVPLHNVRDVAPILKTLSVAGMYLTPPELSTLRRSLISMDDIAGFFLNSRSDGEVGSPLLSEIVANIRSFRPSIARINSVIDDTGEVKDSASEELSRIRQQMASMSGRINAVMRQVMARAVADGTVDADASPTMRDGRLVIPVAPMNKRRISGIVHDESASGKTVFIEPAEVVEVNNRVRELQMDERREIKRILLALALDLRPHVGDMNSSAAVVAEVDFIHAKALYGRRSGAAMPHLSRHPQLELYHACHPILRDSLAQHGREIVPLDICLTGKKRILLISGPNAGGKSVTLKTVGVMQYMMQCGVLPIVYENSHMGIFEDIFIDIGDDQSIEDDLSTYSSHLRNMKCFVERARPTSLILIDEFGAGTEPQIGGAIAQAILRQLNDSGVWGVITTHYQNLKNFAADTEGLVNGSMLYDRQRMQPLFQLSVGNPGSSFALEIARKTGLSPAIIDEAKEIVGSDYVNMDKYLLDIARDRRYWENKRLSIRQKEKKIEDALERYEAEADTLRSRRNEIISQAKMEAKEILSRSNAVIENAIHDIRKVQAEKEATKGIRATVQRKKDELLADETDNLKSIKKLQRKKKKPAPVQQNEAPAAQKDFRVGDVVKLDGQTIPGRILEIEGRKATVVFGLLKTSVEVDRLKRSDARIDTSSGRHNAAAAASEASIRQRQLDFSRQLDVRGMRADEALQAVTYYLDDAIQFGADRVRILHGTGTGALRQTIRQYLDTVAAVRSFHDEHVQFGGAGITVVEF